MISKWLEENLSPIEELLLQNPEEFESAVKRGVEIDITVHKFTHPLLRKYGKQGKIQLSYAPAAPDYKVEMFEGKDNIITSAHVEKNSTLYVKNDLDSIRRAGLYIYSLKKYPIPSGKVDTVFDMIEAGRNNPDIVNFLTH